MKIIFIGLSITSSWGNGHATTYRGLVRELAARGHEVLFLEHDKPWYAANRDLPHPPYGRMHLYGSVEELRTHFSDEIASADAVIIGSYVPEGVAVGEWAADHVDGVLAFYDIDTPVTLAKLAAGDEEYISAELIACYDLYLSFTGGPTLRRIENEYGSPRAVPLYCSVDPELYFPEERDAPPRWALGYLGTYSADRQPKLERLLLEPARRDPTLSMIVAGPQYPADVSWPSNVTHIEHLPPSAHRRFYNDQRFTLNVTRAEMIRVGHSPSVRLFEATACGVPIISDRWAGLDELFVPGEEILFADTTNEVNAYLNDLSNAEARRIGERARHRVLAQHTAAHRAQELETYLRHAAEGIDPNLETANVL